jgi:hypothetical protein
MNLIQAKSKQNQLKSTKVWNSRTAEEARQLMEDGYDIDNPFWSNDPKWRAANIVFEYTQEERDEIKRCAQSPEYFADKYAFSMTDEGIQKINLRDYQREALKELLGERFVVWMASRQVGKCPLFSEYIKIRNKKTSEEMTITIGEFYLLIIKAYRRLTFLEKCKYLLWKIFVKIN